MSHEPAHQRHRDEHNDGAISRQRDATIHLDSQSSNGQNRRPSSSALRQPRVSGNVKIELRDGRRHVNDTKTGHSKTGRAPTETTSPPRLHVSLILDASGSMEASRKPAILAVNRYLARLHDKPAARRTRVSITFFNSHAIDTVRDREDAAECPFIREAEYQPRGRTPLLDAIGYAAGLQDCLSRPDERRVLAILTDGVDTASRRFTPGDIRALLKRNQRRPGPTMNAGRDNDLLVLYLGVDHDSLSQADELGIPRRWAADLSRSRFTAAGDLLADITGRCHVLPRSGPDNVSGLTEHERVALRR